MVDSRRSLAGARAWLAASRHAASSAIRCAPLKSARRRCPCSAARIRQEPPADVRAIPSSRTRGAVGSASQGRVLGRLSHPQVRYRGTAPAPGAAISGPVGKIASILKNGRYFETW